MNIELLRKIQQAIKQHPEHFNMSTWFDSRQCGTTACIAGWAITLTDNSDKLCPVIAEVNDEIIEEALENSETKMLGRLLAENDGMIYQKDAEKLLCISRESSNKLLYKAEWPINFRAEYESINGFYKAKTISKKKAQKQLAEVAYKRIEHFIATNGEE